MTIKEKTYSIEFNETEWKKIQELTYSHRDISNKIKKVIEENDPNIIIFYYGVDISQFIHDDNCDISRGYSQNIKDVFEYTYDLVLKTTIDKSDFSIKTEIISRQEL